MPSEAPDSAQARDAMILDHYSLVTSVAFSINRRLPAQVEVDDLISLGTQGLIRAVDNFDPDAGNFQAFASQCIRGAILDGLRALDWAPRSLRRKARKIKQAQEELEGIHGGSPSAAAVATHMGVDPAHVTGVQGEVSRVYAESLDRSSRHGTKDGGMEGWDSYHEVVAERRDSVGEEAAMQSLQGKVVDRIQKLPLLDQLFLALYYYEERTLAEAAKILGISESRASHIHTSIVMDLRSYMKGVYAS